MVESEPCCQPLMPLGGALPLRPGRHSSKQSPRAPGPLGFKGLSRTQSLWEDKGYLPSRVRVSVKEGFLRG